MKKRPTPLLCVLIVFLCCCQKTQTNDLQVTILPDNSLEVQVHISNPGSLHQYLSTTIYKSTGILRISGSINGDDIQAIRDIMSFQKSASSGRLFKVLDLSECDFENGGAFLFPKESYENINGELVTMVDSIWVFPSEPHVVPRYAFACVGLQSVILSSSVSAIGDYAFEYNSIIDLSIPTSVKSIGEGAFYFTYIQSAITIPEGVTALPDSVFFDASQIPSLTLPSTIQSLGKRCLGNCLHLSEIIVKSEEPPVCDDSMWDDWYIGSRFLYVPQGSITKYRSHPVWGRADIITEIKQ